MLTLLFQGRAKTHFHEGQGESLFIWKEKATTEWMNIAKSSPILTFVNHRSLKKCWGRGLWATTISTRVTSQDGQMSLGGQRRATVYMLPVLEAVPLGPEGLTLSSLPPEVLNRPPKCIISGDCHHEHYTLLLPAPWNFLVAWSIFNACLLLPRPVNRPHFPNQVNGSELLLFISIRRCPDRKGREGLNYTLIKKWHFRKTRKPGKRSDPGDKEDQKCDLTQENRRNGEKKKGE